MIRAATPEDVPAIHAMVRELAAFEKAPHEARATVEQLHAALFGPDPVASALVAVDGPADGFSGPAGASGSAADAPTGEEAAEETGAEAGTETGAFEPVGFALWFRNFSTWTGTPGLYLEDLYVRPEWRGAGHGGALLAELAAVCVERGYERFEWSVLDWNEKALAVYRSIGALPQDEWTVQRLGGPALRALAERAAGADRSPNQARAHAR
ncbi:GNAT family N-acetyltransferase [Actinacidiphila yeochonensis]|uniref:GNAT family N-acetyltransferase n=1 Tax=Actinacidiphila yeochonensis TaxID=89050 RepID=UPI00055F62B8|nr:GNAT family N-acetyltransferase [Actinacidiphila yeochonensis]